jgi:hypothetical protein
MTMARIRRIRWICHSEGIYILIGSSEVHINARSKI